MIFSHWIFENRYENFIPVCYSCQQNSRRFKSIDSQNSYYNTTETIDDHTWSPYDLPETVSHDMMADGTGSPSTTTHLVFGDCWFKSLLGLIETLQFVGHDSATLNNWEIITIIILIKSF